LSDSEGNVTAVQSTYLITLISNPKFKASVENVHFWYKQTRSRRRLRHSLVRASSMTVCCSRCYTSSIMHCLSSLTSRILF